MRNLRSISLIAVSSLSLPAMACSGTVRDNNRIPPARRRRRTGEALTRARAPAALPGAAALEAPPEAAARAEPPAARGEPRHGRHGRTTGGTGGTTAARAEPLAAPRWQHWRSSRWQHRRHFRRHDRRQHEQEAAAWASHSPGVLQRLAVMAERVLTREGAGPTGALASTARALLRAPLLRVQPAARNRHEVGRARGLPAGAPPHRRRSRSTRGRSARAARREVERRGRVRGRAAIDPLVDHPRVVHGQPDAVVADRLQPVGAGRGRLEHAAPAHREAVHGNAGAGARGSQPKSTASLRVNTGEPDKVTLL